jgi:probable rRNA maturation factor
MAVLIDNQQKNHPIEIKKIQRKAQAILNALGCPDDELSIVLVDDRVIAELNEHHLNHQGSTNVISFSMREGKFGDINPHIIGDVVISLAGLSFTERFDQLLVHGILHLFGYDHIQSRVKAREMEAKSEEILEILRTE